MKKALLFNEEEIQIMNDFSEKVLDEVCKEFNEDCIQCPFNGYCCRIAGFIETVTMERHWIQKEEN